MISRLNGAIWPPRAKASFYRASPQTDSARICRLALGCVFSLAMSYSASGQGDPAPLAAAKAAAEKASQELAATEKAAQEAKKQAEKATADAGAAQQALSGKTEAARRAIQVLQAQETYFADKAVVEAKAAVAKAEAAARQADAASKETKQQDLTTARQALLQSLERAAVAKADVIGGLKPLAASDWTYEKARHLLFRAGLGGPPEDVAKLYEMGLFAAVDYLVDYHLQPEPAGWFDAFPHLRTAPYEHYLNDAQRAELNQARVSFRWDQHHRLRRAWLERMAQTQRPLQEKLTFFWHGHFACSYLPAEDSYSMWQQNEMFRRRAAGSFGALLRGITHDPAMIRYLDNHVNFKASGNENLGREILELFSMGEGQGYTEKDLAEAARALTGFNFEYNEGQFKFIAARHDDTEKTLFGKKGNFGGDELVDLILQQPATARYITRKLFRFFAHDNPDQETIDKLADVLRAYQYELRPMLRNFFQSEEFYSSRSMGNHIKSPVELVLGAIRTLKLENKVDYGAIDSIVSDMGQRLFEPPNVAGWEGGRAWVDASSLLLRYNALSGLVEKADLVAWLEQSRTTDGAVVVDHLSRAFLCVPLSGSKRQELIAFLGELPSPDKWAGQRDVLNDRLRAVLVALVSLPEYQLAHARPTAAAPALELAALSPR